VNPAESASLARALDPKSLERREVQPLLKVVVDKPWTERRAKAHVHARSGGRCELGGPTCTGLAHDVDHVLGRRGPDPWNPAWLLHVCGFGNKNDGCHEWTSSTNVGRAASIAVAEQIAGRS